MSDTNTENKGALSSLTSNEEGRKKGRSPGFAEDSQGDKRSSVDVLHHVVTLKAAVQQHKFTSTDGVAFAVGPSEVHITWDEPTIAEHDKLRGTRQKIDEPSTPYHYGSGESSQGSDCESADGKGAPSSAGSSAPGSPHHHRGRNRRGSILKVMADVSAALPSESALRRERQARWDSDVSEGSSHEDKEKARQFKQHREEHYNEFRALREWRDKKAAKIIDDSDDSEDCGDSAIKEAQA